MLVKTKVSRLTTPKNAAERVSSMNRQYVKITGLYLYPIKSCASMKIAHSWTINSDQGLLYDRHWVIVDANGVVLTQKRLPLLTQLEPCIDLARKKLILTLKSHTFALNISSDDAASKKCNIVLGNMSNQTGFDEGDVVATWLSQVFELKDTCRLIRTAKSEDSFVNKADYLLINERSIAALRKYLMASLSMAQDENEALVKRVDEFLVKQFRPNFIVSAKQEFAEEQWQHIQILSKNIQFKVLENCPRCQMININQSVAGATTVCDLWSDEMGEKYCSMLLKQLHKLKMNSKFGVYLAKMASSSGEVSVRGVKADIASLVERTLLENKNSEISVGDIGVTF